MKINIKSMCMCSLFSILIAIGAFIKVPISIVPITLQTLFVVLAAIVLKNKLASGSVLLYLIIGLIGLPVFANGGGLMYIVQPTFGYLLGFLVAAYVVGTLAKRQSSRWYLIAISIVGMLLIYAVGMAYFVFIQQVYYGVSFEWSWIFYYLFLVYLPGDLISCVVAGLVGYRLQNISKQKEG